MKMKMTDSFVDAYIKLQVTDILSDGRMTDRAIDRARALYRTYSQPGLDTVLDSLGPDGRTVRQIALFGKMTGE